MTAKTTPIDVGDRQHTADPTPLAVNVERAAQLVGVNRTTVHRLVVSGELTSFTIGRARRIRVADIEAWMERRVQADSVALRKSS